MEIDESKPCCEICKKYSKDCEDILCKGLDCKIRGCADCGFCSFKCKSDIKLVEAEILDRKQRYNAAMVYLNDLLDDLKQGNDNK